MTTIGIAFDDAALSIIAPKKFAALHIILIHSENTLISKKLAELFPTSTQPIGKGLQSSTYAGKDLLVSFCRAQLPSRRRLVAKARCLSITKPRYIAAIMALILAAFCMIGAMALLLRHLVVRPVSDMTTAMTKIAGGDLAVPVPGQDRTDQIGSMAAAVAAATHGLASEAATLSDRLSRFQLSDVSSSISLAPRRIAA